jgi:hypothetical protein
MINKIALSIFLIIIYILPQNTHAESDTLASILRRFITHQEQEFQEKIYVRLDKSYYLSGEFLRFSVYCFDAKTKYPARLSKVAYIELLDSNHISVIQAKVHLDEGYGYGEVFIPSNFKSGNYLLRSYTSWMKNYRADLFFHSIVHIINPFVKPGLKAKSEVNAVDIQFFPEGDALVNGINSKIAFKATNAIGQGIDFSGSLIDDQGNVILEFSPAINGIGSFNLIPDNSISYIANVVLEDSTVIHPKFPEIKAEGHVLKIDNLNTDVINVDILSNLSSLNHESGNMYIIGQTGGKIQFAKTINVENGSARVSIKKETIVPGIMQITLFNSVGNPINERVIFIYPKITASLQINTEKAVFKNREKVTVEIIASDDEGKPISLDLSISVLLHNEYFDRYKHNIQAYLLLNGELNGIIENPDYYLDGQSYLVRQAMDNLMLTHNYRAFLWEDLNTDSNQKVFIPEYRYHIITGTLTNKKLHVPEDGIFTYLSIPSKNALFYSTKSEKSGKLFFEIHDFIGKNEMVFQVNNIIDTIYQISIDNPFSEKYADFNIPVFDIDENMKHFIEKASISMQIQNAYFEFRTPSSIISEKDTSTFYHPNKQYYLDNYTRFPVMEEVMREYVGGVIVRKNQDGFYFRMGDYESREIFQQDPLILLDGVPVFDADEIMKLDPLKIQKIETVSRRFLRGVIDFSGIVSLSTYKGDLDGYQLNKSALVLEYDGVQPRKKYFTPAYDIISEENTRIPDHRNVLYWNPQFKTDENGTANLEFYTSDDISVYEIIVEGLSNDGVPLYGSTFIQVTNEF